MVSIGLVAAVLAVAITQLQGGSIDGHRDQNLNGQRIQHHLSRPFYR